MNRFPCVIMRGGTSKGIFFNKKDMPADSTQWESFLLDVMGSPDIRQIDGLGGANSLTSKVAIIAPSELEGVDIDYTFAQVSITESMVDMKGNCGNISSAVGPYSVDEGLVAVEDGAESKKVVIRNTNTDKMIVASFRIKDGRFDPSGDVEISGVPGHGSKIGLSFHGSEGAATGRLLPTGNAADTIETSKGKVKISIVDAANPLVFIPADAVGLRGNESPSEFSADQLTFIEEIRSIAAEMCGFADRSEATVKSPAVPKATIISSPQAFISIKGEEHSADEMDVTVRMMSMQKPHQALAITGAVCISLASAVDGTIAFDVSGGARETLRIGHPGGVMDTGIIRESGKISAVEVLRTARRIMEGHVFTHKNY